MEFAKVVLYWSRPGADIELGSSIDPQALRMVKYAILCSAEHRVAAAIGDELAEMKARHELKGLQALLDNAVPDSPPRWRGGPCDD